MMPQFEFLINAENTIMQIIMERILCRMVILLLLFLGWNNIQTAAFSFHTRQTNNRKQNTHHPTRNYYLSSSSLDSNEHVISLPSSTTNSNGEESSSTSAEVVFINKCRECSATFSTRNSLFRHIRNDHSNQSSNSTNNIIKKDTAIILISYQLRSKANNKTTYDKENNDGDRNNYDSIASSKLAGILMKEAFEHALQIEVSHSSNINISSSNGASGKYFQFVTGSTQSSVANMRHQSLSQESGIDALGDVMTISYSYPVTAIEKYYNIDDDRDGEGDDDQSSQSRLLDQLLLRAKHSLIEKTTTIPELDVRLISGILLSSSGKTKTRFHAEGDCTQRAYHYLLPLQWLPDGKEIEDWWLDCSKSDDNPTTNDDERQQQQDEFQRPKKQRYNNNNNKHNFRGALKPPSLRMLKETLRDAESVTIQGGRKDYNTERLEDASGRFGFLSWKERRAWHNFADPRLKGSASPNNKPVWKVLDRCRVVQFQSSNDSNHNNNDSSSSSNKNKNKNIVAVVECRGDDFVNEQVRRIIGASIAITQGWLPQDFFELATRSDVFVETPIAPPSRLYLAETRFHFDELTSGDGNRIFKELMSIGDIGQANVTQFQRSIIDRCSFDEATLKAEEAWLVDLRDNVCPRIRSTLNKIQDFSESYGEEVDDVQITSPKNTPAVYKKSLALLRNITESGQWPMTSIARSKVIRDGGVSDVTMNVRKESIIQQSGSFTITNPKFKNGLFIDENVSGGINVPKANKLFPDLVDAIFELEETLSIEMATIASNNDSSQHQQQKRLASSHCAVNRNAQFTPHVDSGRGSGQSLSMIVGLGNYLGGELLIEGESNNIFYNPLEFDGWKERHWTAVSVKRDAVVCFIKRFVWSTCSYIHIQ
jgi:tRNA U38,U39,U40 pseudouridine synthase TruA